jgi:hypothetical protein
MSSIRITSAGNPFDSAQLARRAVEVITTASAMGLLRGVEIEHLDLPSFRRVVDRLAGAGIGTELSAALSLPSVGKDPGALRALVDGLRDAIEVSPVPESEWGALEDLFGVDLLARLLQISPASVRRYRSSTRATPDDVAARLHFLANVAGDLAGTYNEIGVRRWFQRPRTALEGKTPAELLVTGWDPDAPGPARVRQLSRSLLSSPAT